MTWIGLLCSLAFLPVLLAAALLTVGSAWFGSIVWHRSASAVSLDGADRAISSDNQIGLRRWICVIAAATGVALPTAIVWNYAHCNLLNVWWMNYRNHAGFYLEYPRTYWKWLLVNPIELSFAAGYPIFLLALAAGCHMIGRFRSGELKAGLTAVNVVCTVTFVWGLLWLTGKNSGEAARLWVLFLPWLIWLASTLFDDLSKKACFEKHREWHVMTFLAMQFLMCLLTVSRVSGFPTDWN